MTRLVLVGLPGTGKSTVAKALAARWGVEAIDTDDVLSLTLGRSAPTFLRDEGEEEFRRRELEVLLKALETEGVVSTGGGAVTLDEARRALRSETTFWLDCADEEILRRVAVGDRPLLEVDPVNALARLRAQRQPWYEEVSQVRIDSSGKLEEVVERVLDQMRRAHT